MQKSILLIHGPNLGRLGKREPHIYGSTSLADLESALTQRALELDLSLHCFQSNHEGELIDRIEKAVDEGVKGCILNAGALTHTSIALLDCISASDLPTVEVHISNIHRREAFRNQSITAKACIAMISGMGLKGYEYALDYLKLKLDSEIH